MMYDEMNSSLLVCPEEVWSARQTVGEYHIMAQHEPPTSVLWSDTSLKP